MSYYDRVIIGAGLYGLYGALICGKKGQRVVVLEYENQPFSRATFINQARVHNGYHYPRSFSTVSSVTDYFHKFNSEFEFCINSSFKKIYATSSRYSWTNAVQFKKFCKNAEIKCVEVEPGEYFNSNMCDGAFEVEEYTYDATILRDYFLEEIKKYPTVELRFNVRIKDIQKSANEYLININDQESISTGYILNATYASVNQINKIAGFDPFKIKYELCEVILCHPGEHLKGLGITIMDGPFFSIMPFGKTGLHSLTSVTFTPHLSCHESLPVFECQKNNPQCSDKGLYNCNDCDRKPESSWTYMSGIARKYLRDKFDFSFYKSLYSMKPILLSSEIDDSRPTIIRKHSENPTFVSVLSGKISTVYDLNEVL